MSGVIPPTVDAVTALAEKLAPADVGAIVADAHNLVNASVVGDPAKILASIVDLIDSVITISAKYGAPAHVVAGTVTTTDARDLAGLAASEGGGR